MGATNVCPFKRSLHKKTKYYLHLILFRSNWYKYVAIFQIFHLCESHCILDLQIVIGISGLQHVC